VTVLEDRPSFGNAVVPMDDRGEAINEPEFRQMLRYMSDGGTTVFVGGPHATEFVNMDRAERRRLWELAVDELSGTGQVNAIPFGPASTTEMIAMFRLASSMGFDGAQLYPGAQEGRGADGLFIAEAERYYRDVLESLDLPIYLCAYHGGEIIDSPNKQIPLELVITLVQDYPHIKGVTIADQEDQTLRDFVDAIGESRPVRLAGAFDWYGRMEMGVYGFHSIQQSIAPALCSTMMAAFHAGEKGRAKQLGLVLRQLNEIVHTPHYYYPRSLKPILNHLGFDMGIIRRPYLPPNPDLQREMCTRIDELDLGRFEDLPSSPNA
jgi:dihydrodipicolinate synthase/N-acetylneuraminate lyase